MLFYTLAVTLHFRIINVNYAIQHKVRSITSILSTKTKKNLIKKNEFKFI